MGEVSIFGITSDTVVVAAVAALAVLGSLVGAFLGWRLSPGQTTCVFSSLAGAAAGVCVALAAGYLGTVTTYVIYTLAAKPLPASVARLIAALIGVTVALIIVAAVTRWTLRRLDGGAA